jgi:fatty-acyl-CoA synthase
VITVYPGAHAVANPDKPAVIMADTGQTLTYQQLEERSLRLANAFRDRGLVPRDHVAVVAENRLEIVEALWAALRTGTYITAVNRHLTAEEAAYIVHDCGAKALLLSGELETADELAGLCADVPQRIGIGRTPDGFERYEDVLAAASTVKPEHEPRGDDMLYSSGTTGRRGTSTSHRPRSPSSSSSHRSSASTRTPSTCRPHLSTTRRPCASS